MWFHDELAGSISIDNSVKLESTSNLSCLWLEWAIFTIRILPSSHQRLFGMAVVLQWVFDPLMSEMYMVWFHRHPNFFNYNAHIKKLSVVTTLRKRNKIRGKNCLRCGVLVKNRLNLAPPGKENLRYIYLMHWKTHRTLKFNPKPTCHAKIRYFVRLTSSSSGNLFEQPDDDSQVFKATDLQSNDPVTSSCHVLVSKLFLEAAKQRTSK